MHSDSKPLETVADREMSFTRLIDAPREKLFRCWTDPELIPKLFTPPPWKTKRAEVDLRAGGSSLVVMCSPDGTGVPNCGVYLEVVRGK